MEYVAQRNFLRRGYQYNDANIEADKILHPDDHKNARILSRDSDFLTWDGTGSQMWQRFIQSPLTEPHLYENETKTDFRYQRTGPAEEIKKEQMAKEKAWTRALTTARFASRNAVVFDEDDEDSDEDTNFADAKVADAKIADAKIADAKIAKTDNGVWTPTYEELMAESSSNDEDLDDGETMYSRVERDERLEKGQAVEETEEDPVDKDIVYWPAPRDLEDDSDDSDSQDTSETTINQSSENPDTAATWFPTLTINNGKQREKKHESSRNYNIQRKHKERSFKFCMVPTLATIPEEDEEHQSFVKELVHKKIQCDMTQKPAEDEEIEQINKIVAVNESHITSQEEEIRQTEIALKEKLRMEEKQKAKILRKRKARKAKEREQVQLHADSNFPGALKYEMQLMEETWDSEAKKRMKEIDDVRKYWGWIFWAEIFLQMAAVGLKRDKAKEKRMRSAVKRNATGEAGELVMKDQNKSPLSKTVSRGCTPATPSMIFKSSDLEVTFYSERHLFHRIKPTTWETAQQWMAQQKEQNRINVESLMRKDVEISTKWIAMEKRMTARINNQSTTKKVLYWSSSGRRWEGI